MIYGPVTPASGWNERLTYSAAVRAGNLLFVSGMTASDDEGRIIGVGDIVAQTRYIFFEKMRPLLQEAGADFSSIVETVEYITTVEGYKGTAQVRREVFHGPPFPAATGVLVAGLLRKDALIEIRATAVLETN